MTKFRATDPDWYENALPGENLHSGRCLLRTGLSACLFGAIEEEDAGKETVFAVEDLTSGKFRGERSRRPNRASFSPRDEGVVHLFQFRENEQRL